MNPNTVKKIIRTLNSANTKYVMISDYDDSACITNKKDRLNSTYSKIIKSNIIISRLEIESWYLAGLDGTAANRLSVPHYGNTENVSKEDFDKNRPDAYPSRIDFMCEVFKKFKFEVAIKQNASFDYFVKKKTSPSLHQGVNSDRARYVFENTAVFHGATCGIPYAAGKRAIKTPPR